MNLPAVKNVEEEGEIISITERHVTSMMVDDDGHPIDEMGFNIVHHYPDRPWPRGNYITSHQFHNWFPPAPKPSLWKRLKIWLEREF